MSNGSSVIIEQEDPSGATRFPLRVEFAGPLLPTQGIELGGEQRLGITRPVGAESPTVQVLGVEELPISLSGELRDTYFADPGGAAEIAGTLDRMRREGLPVRVTWGTTWDRLCVIESYAPVFIRADLIRWTMRLLVLQRDDTEDAQRPPDGQRGGADVTRASAALGESSRAQRARQAGAWPLE